MKGQAAVMEYVVLILVMMFIILGVFVLLFGSQFFAVGSERAIWLERESLFLMQSMISSTVINNLQYQNSVLDDSKLMSMDCERMEKLFGEDMWVEVRLFYDTHQCDGIVNPFRKQQCLNSIEALEDTECTGQNYPYCGSWTFCDDNKEDRMIYRSIPVNIYRKMNGTVSLGVLTVGLPSRVST